MLFPCMIPTLIVEDDPMSQDYLKKLLSGYPEIHLVGTAFKLEEARNLIVQYNPALLFLDVELGCSSGFDLLNELREIRIHPTVIFTTAYDKYAIEAIRYAAFDYLLKPYDPEDLKKVMERYSNQLKEDWKGKLDHLFYHLHGAQKILFNLRNGSVFIDPDDIFYCEADGNYSTLFLTQNRKEFITCQIGQILDRLPLGEFLRLGRSLLLHRKYISRIDRNKKQVLFEKNNSQTSLNLSMKQIRELSGLLER